MELEDRLWVERDLAYKKAIDSLGRYKFYMFGYWAAKWVTINNLLGFNPANDKQRNPFKSLVKLAQEMK